MFEWAYSGVDFDLAGNGGIECRDFLSIKRRIFETIFASVYAGCFVYFVSSNMTLPTIVPPTVKNDRVGKKVLLVLMCLTFGIELGFKLATRQMIYLMNPCHLATMMQVRLISYTIYS